MGNYERFEMAIVVGQSIVARGYKPKIRRHRMGDGWMCEGFGVSTIASAERDAWALWIFEVYRIIHRCYPE